MSEFLSNYGHAHIKKESNKGTAVIPTVTLPLIGETITTDIHAAETKLLVGHGFARHFNFMGQRSHMGDLTLLAEPNTAGYLADMNLTKGSTTGSTAYTHPFTKSATTNPSSYTLQIQRGDTPYRYFGVEGRGLQMGFQDGVGQFTAPITARGVFSAVEIASIANTDELTFISTYNTNPTAGLVATDTIRIYKAGGGVVDTTVTTVDSAVQITVASASGVTAGDIVTLRALSPSLSISDPVLWARSEYRFSNTDASTALAATHTPIEPDSGNWNLLSSLQTDEGEGRSGSFDRASLARTIADVELSTRHVFDSPTTERDYLLLKKKAIVIRHFCGASHEIRLTINHAKAITKPNPLTVDSVIYDEFTWRPQYDSSDATALSMTIINGVSTI